MSKTISNIINTPSESWINEFTGIPTDLTQRKGQKGVFYTGKLRDPQYQGVEIETAFFRQDIINFSNRVCHFQGKGMKRTEYNGQPKVTVGAAATVQMVGDPNGQQGTPPPAQPQSYAQAPQNPPQAPAQPQGYSAPPPAQPAPQGAAQAPQKTRFHGATVGMAINKSIDLVIAGEREIGRDGSNLGEVIHTTASDILRVAVAMENGNLYPKESERTAQAQGQGQQAAPAPQQPAPAQAHQPDPNAWDPDNDSPDNIPF